MTSFVTVGGIISVFDIVLSFSVFIFDAFLLFEFDFSKFLGLLFDLFYFEVFERKFYLVGYLIFFCELASDCKNYIEFTL